MLTYHDYFLQFSPNWGEWPSRLRHCDQNQEVPGLNPTRCSVGLRDPTSLWGSRWPLGRICKTQVINMGWVRLCWLWGSQIAVKKQNKQSNKQKTANQWFNFRAFGYQPPQKHHLNFFAKPPLKSSNCPSPPFLDNPPYILFSCDPTLKIRFFSEPTFLSLIPIPSFKNN